MKALFRCSPLMLVLLSTACGGSDPVDPGPTPTIELQATPAALNIVQGQSGTVQLALVRGGGYSGNVSVSTSGLPAGVSAAVSPSPITGTTTSATVTVTSTLSAAPGTYDVTVTASASGVTGVSDVFELTITAAPAFSIALAQNALSVNAGSSVGTDVTITRTNLPGAVTLTLDAPDGITGTFVPAAPTTNSSALTIAVDESVAPGDYTLTVNAAASTFGVQSATLTLTVFPLPDFTLSISQTPVAILAGESGNATVTLARTNFTGDVEFSLVAPPAGITATFDPATTADNSSEVTINVGSGVAAGEYDLTVQGTGDGVGIRTAMLPIEVSVPVVGTTVEWMVCDQATAPQLFVYRDGAGPWIPVTATQQNGVFHYTFQITSDTATVAYLTPALLAADIAPSRMTGSQNARSVSQRMPRGTARSSGMFQTSLHTRQIHFHRSDAATVGMCSPGSATGQLDVSVDNLTGDQFARILSRGGASRLFRSNTSTGPITTVAGAHDMWIMRQNDAGTVFGSEVRRAVAVPGPLTIDAATMAPASTATVTLTGVPSTANVFDAMWLTTATGRVGPFGLPAAPLLRARPIVANSTSQSGDLYEYEYSFIDTQADPVFYQGNYFLGATISDRVIAAHPAASEPSVTTASTSPVTRLRASGAIPAVYNDEVALRFFGEGSGFINVHDITATAAWRAAQGSPNNYALTMADLGTAQWPALATLPNPYVTSLILTGSNFDTTPTAGSYRVQVEWRNFTFQD